MDKTLAFNIEVTGVSNEAAELAKIEYQLRNLKKEKRELDKLASKGFLSAEDRAKLAAYNKEVERQTKIQKELKRVMDSAPDSLNRMRSELIKLKDAYGSASAAARDKMAPAIKKLNDEVSKAEQAIGVHQRNVGNYPNLMSAFSGGFKSASGDVKQMGMSLAESAGQMVSIAGIAGIAITVFNKLKETFLSTVKGIDTFNIAMQMQKQLLYDIIKGQGINVTNMQAAAEAQKKLNEIRAGDREDLVQFAKLEREIAILEFQAADKTKDRAVRQESLNRAIQKQNELSDKKLGDIGEELDVVNDLLENRRDDETLLKRQSELKATIYNLDKDRFEQSKRNESRMTGFMQEEKKEQEAAIERWYKEIEAWNEKNALLEKGTKEYAAMQDEIAKVIIAEAELANAKMGNIDDGKYKAPDGSLKNSEIEAMAATNDEKERLWQEGLIAAQENFRKNKEQQQQAAEDTRQIDLAALDSKQAIVDAEIMITEGLSAAISEISGKNKAMTLAALAIEKSAAIAQIIANISIANAKSIATFPLAAGQPWVTLNTGLGAISIANLVAQTVKATSEISGYATGGRIQGGLQLHGDKSRDNTLIYVKQNETVLTESQVARLGGSGAMRKAKVPGYAMGGYVGQQAPEIPGSGFDYAQLARLMNSIEVKLDVNKVNAAQREISVITEPQRI